MEEHYNLYLYNCYLEGADWKKLNRPYTYTEWVDNNCPVKGGVELSNNEPER